MVNIRRGKRCYIGKYDGLRRGRGFINFIKGKKNVELKKLCNRGNISVRVIRRTGRSMAIDV